MNKPVKKLGNFIVIMAVSIFLILYCCLVVVAFFTNDSTLLNWISDSMGIAGLVSMVLLTNETLHKWFERLTKNQFFAAVILVVLLLSISLMLSALFKRIGFSGKASNLFSFLGFITPVAIHFKDCYDSKDKK